MKKKSFLFLMSAFLFCGGLLAQHDNLNYVSADFSRTGSRNASLDGADIVVYNPAGLVKLENGLHISLSNNSFFRKPTHSFTLPSQPEKKYSQASPDLAVPSLLAAYKKDKYSIFGGVYISGGGGAIDFPDGSVNTDLIGMQALALSGGAYGGYKGSLKATSFYITPTVGFAYALSEKFSAALSLKYLNAMNTAKAEIILNNSPASYPDAPLNLEFNEGASGMGLGLSLNYCASEKLNIAIRYDLKSKLDLKTDSIKDEIGIIKDGQKNRRDLPAILALGLNYKVTDKFSTLVGFSYFFQKAADWGTTASGDKLSKLAGDAALMTIGAGYKASEKLELNCFVSYDLFLYPSSDDKASYYLNKLGAFETVKDNDLGIGIGAAYAISQKVGITIALNQWIYPEATIKTPYGFDVTTKNSITVLALGANFHF